jgi:uncharacterized damage-inducible protein DinB
VAEVNRKTGGSQMPSDRDVLRRTTGTALSGKNAHVESAKVLAGLDWKLAGARARGAPHSVFQLVNHMTYWQEWVVKWLDGKRPRPPRHAAGSWPGAVTPANRTEWSRAVKQFRTTLADLNRRARQHDLLTRRGTMSALEILRVIGSHTSYHVGQVAMLRQLLGAWPPPAGGVTW